MRYFHGRVRTSVCSIMIRLSQPQKALSFVASYGYLSGIPAATVPPKFLTRRNVFPGEAPNYLFQVAQPQPRFLIRLACHCPEDDDDDDDFN